MLIRFNVSNFLSFDKSTEFNLLTGDYRRLDNHVHRSSKVDTLKLAAIYGANASGKSNLVKSLSYICRSVRNGELIKFDGSHFKGNKDKNSIFELEFIEKKKVYIYGLEIFKETIVNEYLYLSGFEKDDKLIFDRKVLKSGFSKVSVNENHLKTNKSKILKEHYEKKIVTDKQLFVSAISDIDLGSISKEVNNACNWFWRTNIIFPESKPTYLFYNMLNRNDFMDFTKQMLCSFDTGIKDLHIKTFDLKKYFGVDDKEYAEEIIEDLENDKDNDAVLDVDMIATIENGKHVIKKLFVEHVGFGKENLFSLSEESDGTKRLIEFMAMLFNLLVVEDGEEEYPSIFIIDEIGRSIHPSLLKKFLEKLSKEYYIDGQLIFTTHESNLLDLNMFRPDEIWFVEKNKKSGNSEFKILSDYKNIRTELNIRKGYLDGRFGGIPYLEKLNELNWKKHASN